MKIRNSSLLKIKKLKGKKRFVTRNALCANLKRRPQQTRITDFFGNKPAPTIRKIEIYDGKIKCFQINNQKRIESCERIANYCDNSESFIVLGQEPSTFGCGITGLNNRHNKTYAVMERPRAYIYTHKNLTTWPLDHLCSRDVASLLLDSTKESYGTLLLCSIYWDGRIDTFPQEALEAMKLANLKGYTILLGGDMNARNTIYGSRLTDTRGKVLEDTFATDGDFFVAYDAVTIEGERQNTVKITKRSCNLAVNAVFANIDEYVTLARPVRKCRRRERRQHE